MHDALFHDTRDKSNHPTKRNMKKKKGWNWEKYVKLFIEEKPSFCLVAKNRWKKRRIKGEIYEWLGKKKKNRTIKNDQEQVNRQDKRERCISSAFQKKDRPSLSNRILMHFATASVPNGRVASVERLIYRDNRENECNANEKKVVFHRKKYSVTRV